jgi:hypothetical protein
VQFAATAPAPVAAGGEIPAEPARRTVAGRLDIRL